jgi:hypothetical protein
MSEKRSRSVTVTVVSELGCAVELSVTLVVTSR